MAHILIVVADYYQDITDQLVAGATAHFDATGHSYDTLSVPGAFEIPAAIRFASLAKDRLFDGYIALGCVIRGETSHYDYVCGESARGLNELALTHHLAIGYGILTVENKEQALARADMKGKNKGKEAAEACIRMIALKQQFGVSGA